MTSRPRIQVALVLTGTTPLDDIIAAIPLTATKTWRVGDHIQRTQLTRKDNGWVYGLPPVETLDFEREIMTLLDSVEPQMRYVTEAARRFGLEKEIACAVYMENTTPICNLRASVLHRLAELQVDLDIDLIIGGDTTNSRDAN